MCFGGFLFAFLGGGYLLFHWNLNLSLFLQEVFSFCCFTERKRTKFWFVLASKRRWPADKPSHKGWFFFFFSLLLLSTERALVVWHFIKDLIKCPSPARCLTLNFALRSVGTEAVFLRYVLIRSLSLFPFLFHIRSHTACCSFALAVWVELIPTQIPRDYESCQNRKYFLVLMLRGGKKHTVSLYPSLS